MVAERTVQNIRPGLEQAQKVDTDTPLGVDRKSNTPVQVEINGVDEIWNRIAENGLSKPTLLGPTPSQIASTGPIVSMPAGGTLQIRLPLKERYADGLDESGEKAFEEIASELIGRPVRIGKGLVRIESPDGDGFETIGSIPGVDAIQENADSPPRTRGMFDMASLIFAHRTPDSLSQQSVNGALEETKSHIVFRLSEQEVGSAEELGDALELGLKFFQAYSYARASQDQIEPPRERLIIQSPTAWGAPDKAPSVPQPDLTPSDVSISQE